jgi:predicted negative regulator of RcsB-dependent stress response
MREDLEQEEQLDAIKGFWAENKRWIVPLVTLALLAAAGFNGFNWWKERQAVKASEAFVALENALKEQSLDKAKVAYKVLADDYASTTQAALGGLQMAKVFVSSGDLPAARDALTHVSKNGAAEFAWVARIRMAGVMLDENNAKGALDVLSGTPDKDLAPLVNDRKGDVYAALGNLEEARAAWKLAADALTVGSPTRELVLRKLQSVDAFKEAK